MHVCVFLSQSASVEHSRTVQNGGSAWPTEGSYRPPSVPFPLFFRCFSAVTTTIKRQEEPRGIVSVYVTPRAMGAKVVQEEPRGCTGGTARDRVCVCHATGDGCKGCTGGTRWKSEVVQEDGFRRPFEVKRPLFSRC